jgi:hypothetical protein
MRSAQDYRNKAVAAERLANDLRQPAELRSELRGIARQWRHRAELADWFARAAEPEEPSRRGAAWTWSALFRQLLPATRQRSFASQEPFRGVRPYRIIR